MLTNSLISILVIYSANTEDLECLKSSNDTKPSSTLVYTQFQGQAYASLERRVKRFENMTSVDQVRNYQKEMQKYFVRQLGGFPQRSPLKAKIVGTLQGKGFQLEKIVYQSRPNHHVTAVLFLPKSSGPFPGVVIASGHSRTGKSADYNQRLGIALAKHGIAALCYDPIGQGERSQILSENGKPKYKSTTREHFLIGIGSILVGTNTAQYRVWDGIRAIDYLSSRHDINPHRIGFTGCSGGGTLTSYVMALDDRVVCAAPACYLTTFKRLIETIGPQDAEQNIYGQISFGLDHPDYILMRAPRPTLISASTDDFFDINGTWDCFRQAKRIYSRLGFSEQVDLVEAEGGHGIKPANRSAIVRWMRRWLLKKDDAVKLSDTTVYSEAQLKCTEQGQVLLLEDEKSVFDLNKEREKYLADKRRHLWNNFPEKALQRVRKIAGIKPLADIGELKMEKVGRVQRDNYHIDKLILRTPSGLPLPALTYHPQDPKEDAYLYLHEDGKHSDGKPGGIIEKLVKDNYVVVAVDLRGYGETSPKSKDELLGDWKTYFLAYLLGNSLVGLRTEDTLACGRWVAYYETDSPRPVHIIGIGSAGVPALHAAALQPDLISSVTLRQTISSWSDLLDHPEAKNVLTSTIHGALRTYDLPDLVRSLDPKKITIEPKNDENKSSS